MLRFGCCEWLVESLINCGVSKRNVDIYTDKEVFEYNNFCKIKVDYTNHNVPNCAYHIFMQKESLFYATDTNDLMNISAKDYDLYMVESNYDEDEILERIRSKVELGQYCYEYEVLNNHLSHEKAMNFIYDNIGSNGKYILMHQHVEK